jgi:cytochrome oxidase Cu insertion factor (SCO1/SenC/PrrC family)
MMLRWAAGALAASAAAAICWLGARAGDGAFGLPRAHRAAEQRLAGSDGRPVSLRSGPRLVVFGYAGCAERCPLTLRQLGDAVAAGEPGSRPRVTFVDVDPWNDSAVVLARYVAHFRGVEGVRGDPAALAAHERALGMRPVTRPEDVAAHDTRVFVLDRAGVLVGVLRSEMPASDVRARVRALLPSAP